MSDTTPEIEILKGRTGKMLVGTWERPSGQTLVSVTQLFLDTRSGEWVRKKGAFALTRDEARELSAALGKVAEAVQGHATGQVPSQAKNA